MMRGVAIRLVLWLCSRFDIHPLSEFRIDMDPDVHERSARWELFAKETGGLFDMLDAVKADYLAAMGKVEPGDAKKLEALAIGGHVTDRLRAEVRAVIQSGQVEASVQDRQAHLSPVPIRKSI